MQFEPFAVQLYRQYAAGWTARDIAAQTGIPVERVRQRLNAAEEFLKKRSAAARQPAS